VEQEAIAYCSEMTAKGGGEKLFHGVMYGRVEKLKLTYEHDHSIKTAVYLYAGRSRPRPLGLHI
jgi:hypothetical protein